MPAAISVIMPFHNSESTIGAAIESLLAQDVAEECEFIFVNDGSNDRSVEVLNFYFALHRGFEKRSRLLSYPFRQGVAAAMAIALDNAQGEYIARIDSDDAFEPGALAALLSCAREADADIAIGGIVQCTPGKKSRRLKIKYTDGCLNAMPMTTRYFSLWNKLIRRRLLISNGIMPVGGIDCWEDVGITARAFAVAGNTCFTPKPVYRYTVDPSKRSLSRAPRDLVLRQRLMCALLLEKWFLGKGLEQKYAPFLLNMKFHAKIKLLRGRDCDVRKWRETYPEVNASIMSITQLSLPMRIAFRLADILPVKIVRAICRLLD